MRTTRIASTTNSGFLPASSFHTRDTSQTRRIFLKLGAGVRTLEAAFLEGGEGGRVRVRKRG